MGSFKRVQFKVNLSPNTKIQYHILYFQSIAGVVISLLVASTLVSATQCMKALYHGGLRIDPDESCTICVKVARYNPTKNHQNMHIYDVDVVREHFEAWVWLLGISYCDWNMISQ